MGALRRNRGYSFIDGDLTQGFSTTEVSATCFRGLPLRYFVGGTPTWAGVGTIGGGVLGAVIVSFIQSGVVAAGLSGFWVQLFNGLIIIASLLGHRWNQVRYR